MEEGCIFCTSTIWGVTRIVGNVRSRPRKRQPGHQPADPVGDQRPPAQAGRRGQQVGVQLRPGQDPAEGHLLRGAGGLHAPAPGRHLRARAVLARGRQRPRRHPAGNGTKVRESPRVSLWFRRWTLAFWFVCLFLQAVLARVQAGDVPEDRPAVPGGRRPDPGRVVHQPSLAAAGRVEERAAASLLQGAAELVVVVLVPSWSRAFGGFT